MFTVEWLAKGEAVGPLGGWIKVLSAAEAKNFIFNVLIDGGSILSLKAF